MNAAVKNAIALWQANHHDFGWVFALMSGEDRRAALQALGLK
ncbi:MAG TPA: hypothetical protein VFI55_06930 [Mycobacterium sp.]|nr:hypothetical protein [Mycobacterium sp.]